ncbi:hypothetical protein [Gynuella sunshinyii]|uniref:Lipoprotein n=1 Tax=Gynuella sunshinyii YC6258 TaxID=1445510 RepID=A0A0C5VIN2_9GAMM|nr:hypothetical protein [Gynuella sunshinyii]AJQ94126.1 hypothetical Protein YC6258_02084 [Gynuella sunshinyii YC6258]
MNVFKIIFLLPVLLCSCVQAGEQDVLKQYFFFRCVNEGHSELDFEKFDGSLGYTTDLISSDFSVVKAVSDYAKKVGKSVPVSNHNDKKSVLLICLNAYERSELDALIKSEIGD